MNCETIVRFIKGLNFTLVSVSYGVDKNVIDFIDVESLVSHGVICNVINDDQYKTTVIDEQLYEEYETGKTFIGKHLINDTKENITYNIYLSNHCGDWNIDIIVYVIDICVIMMFNQKIEDEPSNCYISLCKKVDDYVRFGDSVIKLQFVD